MASVCTASHTEPTFPTRCRCILPYLVDGVCRGSLRLSRICSWPVGSDASTGGGIEPRRLKPPKVGSSRFRCRAESRSTGSACLLFHHGTIQGLFRSSENRDAHSRRAPSRLVPAGLPARRHLPGHPSRTLVRSALRLSQDPVRWCGGVWVAVSTHRITSFSPSRSAAARGAPLRPSVVFEP
jgi:hypothetical protein